MNYEERRKRLLKNKRPVFPRRIDSDMFWYFKCFHNSKFHCIQRLYKKSRSLRLTNILENYIQCENFKTNGERRQDRYQGDNLFISKFNPLTPRAITPKILNSKPHFCHHFWHLHVCNYRLDTSLYLFFLFVKIEVRTS